MCAEPAYPGHEEGFEPLAPKREPRYHGTLAPPASPEPCSSPALSQAAESIGGAVGKAVDTVQHLPNRLQEMKQRFTVIRGRAQKDVATRAEVLKQEAVQKASQARTRVEHLARENPLQFILAMAGVGLVLGIVLRIWRDHAD